MHIVKRWLPVWQHCKAVMGAYCDTLSPSVTTLQNCHDYILSHCLPVWQHCKVDINVHCHKSPSWCGITVARRSNLNEQTAYPNNISDGMAKWVEHPSPLLVNRGTETMGSNLGRVKPMNCKLIIVGSLPGEPSISAYCQTLSPSDVSRIGKGLVDSMSG